MVWQKAAQEKDNKNVAAAHSSLLHSETGNLILHTTVPINNSLWICHFLYHYRSKQNWRRMRFVNHASRQGVLWKQSCSFPIIHTTTHHILLRLFEACKNKFFLYKKRQGIHEKRRLDSIWHGVNFDSIQIETSQQKRDSYTTHKRLVGSRQIKMISPESKSKQWTRKLRDTMPTLLYLAAAVSDCTVVSLHRTDMDTLKK